MYIPHRPPAIITYELSKNFKGHNAVQGLNLCIEPGNIYGFLGPNGSGKSTTMKMLLGITEPSSGSIEIFGQELTPSSRPSLLASVGSMIEAPAGYAHLTGRENMNIIKSMLNLSDTQIDDTLTTVRLKQHQNKLVKNYSLGMKQRLGIALALAREPQLLILDEPTNGLDPSGIEEIRRLLIDLADQGITVMVSSHLLDEIEKMATTLGILHQGRMIFQGTREELFNHSTPDLILDTPDPQGLLSLNIPGAYISKRQVHIPNLSSPDAAEVIRCAVNHQIDIYSAYRAPQNLESIFMDLTAGGGLL